MLIYKFYSKREKTLCSVICYRKRTETIDELNCVLNVKQRRRERVLSEKKGEKKRKVMTDINTVERMTVSKLKNKQTKKNTHLAANPTTAEN